MKVSEAMAVLTAMTDASVHVAANAWDFRTGRGLELSYVVSVVDGTGVLFQDSGNDLAELVAGARSVLAPQAAEVARVLAWVAAICADIEDVGGDAAE